MIDDEELAVQLLVKYINQLPDLEIEATALSAVAGIDVLTKVKIDLLFLDIQMPLLNGFDMIKTLKHPPVVVFTTAYSEYAVEAFEMNAVDYLLKPFSFERFLKAVNKAKDYLKSKHLEEIGRLHKMDAQIKQYYTIKSEGKIVRVKLKEVYFIEGLREYVKFVCRDGTYITLLSLKKIEHDLTASRFLRVHKSYIVNIDNVQHQEGNMLYLEAHAIPMGRDLKAKVVEIIFE